MANHIKSLASWPPTEAPDDIGQHAYNGTSVAIAHDYSNSSDFQTIQSKPNEDTNMTAFVTQSTSFNLTNANLTGAYNYIPIDTSGITITFDDPASGQDEHYEIWIRNTSGGGATFTLAGGTGTTLRVKNSTSLVFSTANGLARLVCYWNELTSTWFIRDNIVES